MWPQSRGPGDGVESVRQEVRSERCPGALVQQCEGVALISYERGASGTAEVCPKLYLNCGRETGTCAVTLDHVAVGQVLAEG